MPVDSQNRFDSIAAGVADIECGSSSVSFARMTKVDFSSFIFMENTGLMVRVSSRISGLADLNGKKIAVIIGTTNEAALMKEIQRRQFKTEVIRVKDRSEGIAALQSGAVESFASDKLLLIGARNVDGSIYKMLPENLSSEPYALALPRGDWRLRAAVNKALSQLYSSPQILEIYRKWFTALGERPDLLRAAVYIFGTIAGMKTSRTAAACTPPISHSGPQYRIPGAIHPGTGRPAVTSPSPRRSRSSRTCGGMRWTRELSLTSVADAYLERAIRAVPKSH